MLRVGLLGCGRIAQRHSELLGCGAIDGARLQSVCDLDLGKAESLAAKYGVSSYGSLVSMLEQEDLDVVAVLTDSGSHAENAIAIARFGKHIIVEKPMALTLADADAMIAEAEKYDVQLFVVQQNRFNVPVVKLRSALMEGRLGQITMGTVRVRWCRTQDYYDQAPWRGTWASDGGVLANQASHHIDLLEWMLGDPVSVFAYGRTALVNIETEDTAVALIRFASGALGLVEATTATRPFDLEGSLSILGAKGSVVIDGFAVNELKTWNFGSHRENDEKILNSYSVNPPNVYGFGHKKYYENVVAHLNGSTSVIVDGHDGRKSLRLISAIYQSLETGREIFLDSVSGHSLLGIKND